MEVRRGDVIYLKSDAYTKAVGNIEGNIRPLLVVSNDKGNVTSNICIVVPLTHTKKRLDLPTHTTIHVGDSVVLCEQHFTINQDDIYRIVGRVKHSEMQRIDNCLLHSMGLKRG